MSVDKKGNSATLYGRVFLETGLFAAVAMALLAYGSTAVADEGSAHRVNQDPSLIKLGTSGNNIVDGCSAGTLGSLVEDKDDPNTIFVLSANHVLARTNQALLGEIIIHPGSLDSPNCNSPESSIPVAALSDFVPLTLNCFVLQRGRGNRVDAAIAVTDNLTVSAEILDIGDVDPNPLTAEVGLGVKKSGRTTGLTQASVSAVDVTAVVVYGPDPDTCGPDVAQIGWFKNQILIDVAGFSAPGDSGSLIVQNVEDKPQPVALLFAGSITSTLANPINQVLSDLDVVMAGCGADPVCGGGGGGRRGGGGGGGNGPPGGGGPPGRQSASLSPGLEIASEVKALHENDLFARRGVVGTGISIDDEGEAVIEVYLQSAAGDADRPIPAELEGIPVRVVVTGPFVAY